MRRTSSSRGNNVRPGYRTDWVLGNAKPSVVADRGLPGLCGLLCLSLVGIGAGFPGTEARAQGEPPGRARLQLESERALSASLPVSLLRIGEQTVLLAGGT